MLGSGAAGDGLEKCTHFRDVLRVQALAGQVAAVVAERSCKYHEMKWRVMCSSHLDWTYDAMISTGSRNTNTHGDSGNTCVSSADIDHTATMRDLKDDVNVVGEHRLELEEQARVLRRVAHGIHHDVQQILDALARTSNARIQNLQRRRALRHDLHGRK